MPSVSPGRSDEARRARQRGQRVALCRIDTADPVEALEERARREQHAHAAAGTVSPARQRDRRSAPSRERRRSAGMRSIGVGAARVEAAARPESGPATASSRAIWSQPRQLRVRCAAPSSGAGACRGGAAPRTGRAIDARLDDLAGVHHDHAVGHARDHAEVVRDEQHRPCRRRGAGRAMSARICAWIVTSSAVVGSSAIRRRGPAGHRHGDHHALAHAAGELVRVVVDARSGAGMPTRAHQVDGARRAAARAHAEMHLERPRRSGSPTVAAGSGSSSAPGRSSTRPLAADARACGAGGSQRGRSPSKRDRGRSRAVTWAAAGP